MSESDQVAELPAPPIFVAILGRKGTGKSELAFTLWESWPGDRVVIDVTADVGTDHPDEHTHTIDPPPPSMWPGYLRDSGEERLSLRYVPDHTAPDFREDMDRVVGLAFSHQGTLLWVEETGLVAPSGQVLPHMRRALHMGRHQDLSMLNTFPRAMGVDPLVLAQADVIYCFDLPNPDDRKRLADVTGWDRRTVDDAVAELDEHSYLRFLAAEHELAIFPPLPLRRRQRTAEAHLEGASSP